MPKIDGFPHKTRLPEPRISALEKLLIFPRKMQSGKMPNRRNVHKKSTHWITSGAGSILEKKQKGRFLHEDPDHSQAVRRHRILPRSPPPAPWRAERCRRGRAALFPAGRVERMHRGAVSAPQRRHSAGPGPVGGRKPGDGGPAAHRLHRRAVDAGRRQRCRLCCLHPPRQLRHLRHPAHRRRHRGAAALAV